MKQFYILALPALALASCLSFNRISYIGSSLTPTKNVDVFVDPSAIRRPYHVIGKGYVDGITAYSGANAELTQEKAVDKAKEKGADAILFQDLLVVSDGNLSAAVAVTDSTHNGTLRRTGNVYNPVLSTRREILFIKYD